MPTKKISLLMTVVLSCLFAAAAQGQTVKRIISKSDKLDFGAGGTVAVLGAPRGSIRIEPSMRNESEVNAEIAIEASSDADNTTLENVTGFVLREALGKVVVATVGTNDAKYLKGVAKKFPKRLVGLPYSIDYVIKVPRYCDLQIDGGIGDITVAGVEGAMRINSLEGNSKLGLVGGAVNATFGKGSVDVTMASRGWRASSIDIALASGDLNVHMPGNLNAELDATVLRSGKIENSLRDIKPRVRNVKFTEQSISAKAGNGGLTMKFTVGDGVLRLLPIGKN